MAPLRSSKNSRREEDDSFGEGFSWSQNESETQRRSKFKIPSFVVGEPRSKLYHPSRHLFLKYFAKFILVIIAIVSLLFGILSIISSIMWIISGYSPDVTGSRVVVGIVGIIIGIIAIVLFRKIKIWKDVVVGEARGFNQSDEGKNDQRVKVYRFGIQVYEKETGESRHVQVEMRGFSREGDIGEGDIVEAYGTLRSGPFDPMEVYNTRTGVLFRVVK